MSKQKGVITIEFALGFLALFFTVMGVIEISRFVLISNMVGSVLTESVRSTRIFESARFSQTYLARLEAVSKQHGKFWGMLVEPSQFSYSVKQYQSLSSLVAGTPAMGCNTCPIVFYQVNYDYAPMATFGFGRSTISRNTIAVQEHEDW